MKSLRSLVVIILLTICGCSSENNNWEKAVKINTTAGYKNYIKNYPEGKYIKAAFDSVEALEWAIAFSTQSDSLLEDCIRRYPQNVKINEAKDLQSQIKWSRIELKKADCLEIYTDGMIHSLGVHLYNFDGWDKLEFIDDEQLVKTIFIARSFSEYDLIAKKNLRLVTGVAYLKVKEGYRYIRKVDLSKTDNELANEFGINY